MCVGILVAVLGAIGALEVLSRKSGGARSVAAANVVCGVAAAGAFGCLRRLWARTSCRCVGFLSRGFPPKNSVVRGLQTILLSHKSILIAPLEITYIKYRQRLCGRKRIITVFRCKYNVCTTKICFLLGKYILSTNMNSFLKTTCCFHSKTWAGRSPELAGILYVEFRTVALAEG